jgi:NAD(P)-dependent dehydrogenase (short-subunit alcohol dehydrogenase family)
MAPLLAGRSILITGGGSGIGRDAALVFAGEGALVAVADLSAPSAAETAALVKEGGGEAVAICCDVTRDASVRAMIDAALVAFGRIDGAFNNAGVSSGQLGMSGKKLSEWTEDAFDRAVAINLKGVFLCMKHELARMEKRGRGSIVNTASVAGIVGWRGTSGYVASKHGVVGLTRSAAHDYGADNIRVNAICPGPIRTPMTAASSKLVGETELMRNPMKRMGEPRDIAEMALFLLSDRANFVTGGIFRVDGGTVA